MRRAVWRSGLRLSFEAKAAILAWPTPFANATTTYVLAEVSLSDVYPISGPDEEFDWPVSPAEYERKVEAMVRLLEEGWDAPPLFVHMHTSRLVDGNHRREALLRLGRRTYWAVMWYRCPAFNGRGQPVSLDE
jgi:hypothetical protein